MNLQEFKNQMCTYTYHFNLILHQIFSNVWKKVETETMEREDQIKAIENTFDYIKSFTPQHPTKPHLTPVEVFDVFPNFDLWPNQ